MKMIQVMGLLQVVVYAAASNLESQAQLGHVTDNSHKLTSGEVTDDVQTDNQLEQESTQADRTVAAESYISNGKKSTHTLGVFMRLPRSDLRNLSNLLGREGYDLRHLYSCLGFLLLDSLLVE